MIKNRTAMILIISLMLLAIIGLSAVSATDTVDNNTVENTDTVNIHNNYDNSQVTNDNYKNIGENNKKNLKSDEADSFTNLDAELTDKQEVTLNNDYTKADVQKLYDYGLIGIENEQATLLSKKLLEYMRSISTFLT